MSTILQDFKPIDFGLAEFPEYYPVQLEAIEQAVYGEERFQAIALQTGSGKSLVAMTIAKLIGRRTAVLTVTKGLQKQYTVDFERAGLFDIRGKDNYQCVDMKHLSCADGMRAGCRFKDIGCRYNDRRAMAKQRPLLVTNYDYWMNVNDRTSEGLVTWGKDQYGNKWPKNPFEILILDEANAAPDKLAEYMSVKLYDSHLKDLIGMEGPKTDHLRICVEWAIKAHQEADVQLVHVERILANRGRLASRKELEQAARLEALVGKLETVKGIRPDTDEWVCEMKEGHPKYGRSWEFDVVWPGRYAEQYLFRGIERVVLMSATLRPKTMALLGVGKDQYRFREWPRIFPAQRNPIYFLPARKPSNGGYTMIQIKHKSPAADLELWMEQIDRIIEKRLDRKGIIQSVSYQRQEYIVKHSRFSKYMIGNTSDPESDTATEICETFKNSPVSLILVSPSFSIGWDFPLSTCEYIIIPKVPFKPSISRIMKARNEKDPRYMDYLAMQELVQSSGRGMRAMEDRCEIFVCDGSLSWFLYQNKDLAPKWFGEAVRTVFEVPVPPEKLL